MALGPLTKAALLVILLGLASFLLGVIAENKKPGDDAIQMRLLNNVTICHYPSDPTIVLGIVSIVLLLACTAFALFSLLYPHKGKHLPLAALWKNKLFTVFFALSVAIFLAAEALLLWATVTEAIHRMKNKHPGSIDSCPTAKTGLFGGAAFLALDSSLFWLICLLLLSNVRADYFDEEFPEEPHKGSYTEVAGPEAYSTP